MSHQLHNLKIGKLKKVRSYQYEGVMEAVMMSIENLDSKLKSRYQELAVFLDDVGIPSKVTRYVTIKKLSCMTIFNLVLV